MFTIAHGLSPSTHICGIVAKAHHRANTIHRAFVSRDVSLLLRAYLVYVRPLSVESNSVVWSPFLKQDIDALERVQRRFTKRLPGFNNSTLAYAERLSRLDLPTLELRRLHSDLTWSTFFTVIWNSLPSDTVNVSSLGAFKRLQLVNFDEFLRYSLID